MKHVRSRRSLTCLSCLLVLTVVPATAQPDDEASLREQPSIDFLRSLDQAAPPPMTGARVLPEHLSGAPDARQLVAHDLATGLETRSPGAEEVIGVAFSAPPQEGVLPYSLTHGLHFTPTDEPPSEGVSQQLDPAATCTPPTPNYATHSFPWNTTYKLLMRFESGGANYYYVCSASPLGSFHLLTAGHCLYNHDPNDDGSTADATWASEVWAWAAQTDYVNPFLGADFDEDRPYSFAKASWMRSYTGWTVSGDLNHDMGYVTLDRHDGSRTGWMGHESGVTALSLNFNGYPVETPYVPSGEIRQYPGWDANNIITYTTYRIAMCAYTYGGHSGGPDWRYDGANRYIQGVNSTSNRVGYAEATRITSGKFTDIANIIAEDETVRPPVDRPDLAENFFTTTDDLKDLLDNTVEQGQDIQVEYSVLNAGFAATGTITVDFYASTNTTISTFDYLLDTVTLSSLPAWNFYNPVATLSVPLTVPSGSYYVGWISSSAITEYGGDLTCTNDPCSNVSVIADEMLTVTEACSGDAWEPDDTSGQANSILSGAPQAHNICPVGDHDWVTFALGAPSEIQLETSGPTGDTEMWLYDSGLSLIEVDDDDGTGLFSYIDRVCGFDELAAGTYYVKVNDFGDNDEIDAYDLSYLNVQACAPPCPVHLHLHDQMITGTHTYRASETATLGSNLVIDGTLVEVLARDWIGIVDGTQISGEFSAQLWRDPCP